MATNWNAILSNANSLADILMILRKVLAGLDGKADITLIDEALAEITEMQNNVEIAINEVNSTLAEFDFESQEAIQQVIASGLMEGYLTEVELLASRPTVPKKYAKAEDTDVIWFWNKPEGSLDGNYWTSTGLSPVSQSNLNTDSKLIALLLPALTGKYQDYANKKYAGYINKTNGLFVPNASWYATDFIAITDTAKIFRDGVVVANKSSACSVALYDANFNFLTYYVDTVALFSIRPVDINANAKYVRLSYQATSNSKIYVFEPDVLKFVDDYLTPYIGKPINVAGAMTVGYVLKTDGTLVSFAGWGVTDFIAVDSTSLVTRDADPVSTSSVVAPVACYDSEKNYLGYVQNIDRAEKLKIGRKFPAVKFIRVSVASPASIPYAVYIQTQAAVNINDQVKALDILNSDFFTASDVAIGYITTTGGFVSSANWRTTSLLPCKLGQVFTYSGRGNAATVSSDVCLKNRRV
ncbi:hypothetical protein [Acinetobacter haemolyticus]|uniref:hypothetical protein n=1 Tax=Acinetobacter haemolyticus TaxID=29430 RepID=UPI00209129C4|nr:hypothetical protein [Acinetobacter haemolyticus]